MILSSRQRIPYWWQLMNWFLLRQQIYFCNVSMHFSVHILLDLLICSWILSVYTEVLTAVYIECSSYGLGLGLKSSAISLGMQLYYWINPRDVTVCKLYTATCKTILVIIINTLLFKVFSCCNRQVCSYVCIYIQCNLYQLNTIHD